MFSLAVTITITSKTYTRCAYPPKDGQAELAITDSTAGPVNRTVDTLTRLKALQATG